MMWLFFWFVGLYILIGIVLAVATQDREQDGWLWTILLWPIQLIARFL